MLCFAVKVPNGRNTDVVQEKLLRDCAQPVLAPLHFFSASTRLTCVYTILTGF